MRITLVGVVVIVAAALIVYMIVQSRPEEAEE